MNLQKKIKVRKIIAYVLVAFQFLSYLGSGVTKNISLTVESIAYYFGFNLFLFIGIILLINVNSLKRRLKKQLQENQIESIGKRSNTD